MRILCFNLATDADDPVLGFTIQWIRALAARVQFVHVITMRAGRVQVPGNVQVLSVGKEHGYSEPRRVYQFYKHLFCVLGEDRIDGCFSHMMPVFTVLAAPILKIRRIPTITWYAHPSVTGILKVAHHVSDRMVASVATAYPYKQDKLAVIGQGIDTDLFSPDARVAPASPPVILCAGRLSPVKDHPTLLAAAWLLKKDNLRPFQVVIVGGPASELDLSYARSLRTQVTQLGLEEVVSFIPPVCGRDLSSWYRRCTVHVNLTPTGFGDKVAWESMSCGKPCLAANEGFKETLGAYADRLLFKHGNPEQLAERLSWILSVSEEERAAIGAYLRDRVVSLHCLDRLANNLVDLFKSLKSSGAPDQRVPSRDEPRRENV